MNATPDQEQPRRRHVADRRFRPTPMISRYLFRGRRAKSRRADDPQSDYYVDRFEKSKIDALVAVMILCGLDGILTLIHVYFGGRELNPLMRGVLTVLGGTWFLIIKYVLTAFGMFGLLLHKNFGFVPFFIRGIVGGYVLIIVYHVFVLFYRIL